MEDDVLKQDQADEISLIDLFAVLWHRKVMILIITLLAMAGVLGYSVLSLKLPPEKSFLPNEYTPKALILINNPASSANSLSSMLNSSGLGGLAGLAGVNVSSSQTYSGLAQFLVTTNTFLDTTVDKFDLITKYKIEKSPRTSSRKRLKQAFSTDYDTKSGVFSIKFTDIDPVFARDVINFSVDYLENWFQEFGLDKNVLQKVNLEQNIENTFNDIRLLEEQSRQLERGVSGGNSPGGLPSIMLESRRIALELSAKQEIYRQLRVQLELVNVNIASEVPVFQLLEKAEVPEQKSKPSRGMLCMIVTVAAFSFSVFLAFLLNAVDNIRRDPEAMEKLRSPQRAREDI